MSTRKSTKSTTSDRGRVSSEKYEVAYAAKKVGATSRRGKATAAVRSAKSQLGRKTARSKVMSRARSIAKAK